MEEENQNVEQTNSTEQVSNVIQNSAEQVSKVGQSSTEQAAKVKTKKKGNGGKIVLLIISILLVIAIVGGLIYYFAIYTRPENMYKRLVTSSIDSYTNSILNKNHKTSRTTFELDFNIDSEEIEKDAVDLINKIDIGFDVQANYEDEKFLMNFKADYDKESLLNLQMYSNVKEEKTYVQLENWLKKYIEVEDIDAEIYTSLKEVFKSQKETAESKVIYKNAMKILKQELTSTIKKEYCSSKKEDIIINGKSISTTKNSIKMNGKQFENEFKTLFSNLRNNRNFIKCFKKQDEVVETLDNLIDEVEELDQVENSTIELAIYTSGLMNKIQKVEINTYDSDTDDTGTIIVTKTGDKSYDFELLDDATSMCTGKVSIEEKQKDNGVVHTQLSIPEVGKIELDIKYSYKFNENIEEVNVKNSVKSDELTTDDQKTLVENLEKSKLYELISGLSGGTSSSKNNNMYDILDNNNDSTQDVDIEENSIISYDNSAKITFNIPDGYETTTISNNCKVLRKDDTTINISIKYSEKDKFYEELEEYKKYYEGEDNYNNVQLSELRTLDVDGREFYYATLSYESSILGETYKHTRLNIWTDVSDKNILNYEIDGSENISNEELRELLTINVEEN